MAIKKIEKIPENTFANSWEWENQEQSNTIYKIIQKINELIDVINKLKR